MVDPDQLESIAREAAADLREGAERERTLEAELAEAHQRLMTEANDLAAARATIEELRAELARRPPAPPPPIEVEPAIAIEIAGNAVPLRKTGKRGTETTYRGSAGGVEAIVDVQDGGQIRVTVERGAGETAMSTRLDVALDRVRALNIPLRLQHHTAPTLVTSPSPAPKVDLSALVKAGLVPNYDPAAAPTEADIQRIVAGAGPWGRWNGGGKPYDPITEEYMLCQNSWSGGASELMNEAGPLMPVQVAFLLTGDPRLWEVVRRQADTSGNYAVHYRLADGRYPRPEETGDFPFLQTPESVTLKTAAGVTCPIPEPAHLHSLTYLAAILTGERYYRDELKAWATYCLLTRPKKPERLKGIVWTNQVRGAAWSLRALRHAFLACRQAGDPDAGPLGAQLSANLDWMRDTFAFPGKPYYRPTGICALQEFKVSPMLAYAAASPAATATWNHHILAFELGECIRAGFPEAAPMRDHVLQVIEGVWQQSPSRFLVGWGNHAYPGDDWPAIMKTTFAALAVKPTAFPNATTPAYVAWARIAAVEAVNANRPGAGERLAWIDQELPKYKGGAPIEWRIKPVGINPQ